MHAIIRRIAKGARDLEERSQFGLGLRVRDTSAVWVGQGEDFVAAAGAVGLIAARIPAANGLDRIFGRQCLAGWRVHSVPRFDAWPADIRWGGNHRYPITTGCNRFEPNVSLPAPTSGYAFAVRIPLGTLQEVQYHRKKATLVGQQVRMLRPAW